MKGKTKQASQRLAVFDGYKGIAIISILGYYFYQHILPGGYLAVNFFLLVAGFFNMRHFYLADTRGLKINTWKYYKKRFKRLFFPMLAMIISTAAIILIFARDYLFNIRNMGVASLLFVNNFYQIFNEQSYFVHASNPSAFTHLWYVALLGQLLLLTPIFFKLFYTWHRNPAIAINMMGILTLVSAATMAYLFKDGQDPTNVYYNLLTRAFAYTMGNVLAFLLPVKLESHPLNRPQKILVNTLGILAFVLLFLMSKFMYGTQAFAYRFGMFLYTLVAAGMVVFTIHKQTLINKVLSWPLFTFLGKRSYSYYLWYYPIYLILPNYLRSWNFTLTNIFQFVLLAILAEISYQLFEQDRIKLPIGQHFNWSKMKYQFSILKRSGHVLMNVKVITGIYVFFLLFGTVALAIAPEKRSSNEDDLQTLIEKNEALVQTKQAAETKNQSNETKQENTSDDSQAPSQDTTKVINNIEGLEQDELLFANGLDITFIGDSTLLASADHFKAVFPKAIIDGEVGRQLFNTYGEVNYLQSEGLIMNTVVVMLGSNGTFTDGQIDDFIEAVGTDKSIYFVNSNANRSWVTDANAAILRASQKYGNVQVIDWNTYSNDHPEWIREDEAHPTDEGARQLSVYVAKELFRTR